MPFKGRDKHIRRLRKLSGPEVIKLAGAIVFEGADTIRAEAHRLVSAGSVSGKNHVASAPGEPPNRDTGNLQAHMETEQTGPVEAEFRSMAGHAAPLEFSTSKMEARPYVRPARDKTAPKIRKRFAQQMNKLVKRSG
jgi:HK97 gp10 family phage protein